MLNSLSLGPLPCSQPSPEGQLRDNTAHFATAHRAHALHQLPRLQLEGSAALHLLVPQLYSTSFFGPEKRSRGTEHVSCWPQTSPRPSTTLSSCHLIKVTATQKPSGRTLQGGVFLRPYWWAIKTPWNCRFPKMPSNATIVEGKGILIQNIKLLIRSNQEQCFLVFLLHFHNSVPRWTSLSCSYFFLSFPRNLQE